MGSEQTNKLIHSTSPYLLQHAHNPVDWHPWGAEALEKSRAQNKPIFLSIGYSACHWCHVMEHQCFENPAIAALMNEHFINIKVDREERPDLDELYMLATQLMTGSGGWPMSVWLTPTLQPFYAGTYFPPEDGHGRPGFPRLLQALSDAWKNRRADLEAQAQRVVEAIRLHADEAAGESAGAVESEAWLKQALEGHADNFDQQHGGLGGAPKFPPHQAIALWTHLLASPLAASRTTNPTIEKMLATTLNAMMNGGIYDHVGGAFARYSTDERWLVPHFEKMLYDSAQLAPSYALASVILGREDYAHVARETLDFFLREMMAPTASGGGAFYSTLDADSEGHEGLYYVWTLDDISAALGDPDDIALIRDHFALAPEGNWHESPVPRGNVLEIAADMSTLAQKHNTTPEAMRHRLETLRKKMRAFRDRRTRPGLDDKILTGWNGLMISALAICGRLLREPKYLEAAHRAIGFLLTRHVEGGRRLLRVSRNGIAHTDAFLDDHAFLLNGLLDLIDSTTPTSLPGTMARKRALELADTLIADFQDQEQAGFFFTGPHHEKLFARMKNAADNATPSANGVAIRALLRLARVSGKEHYRETALRAVAAFAKNIARRPEWFSTILLALSEDATSTPHDPLQPSIAPIFSAGASHRPSITQPTSAPTTLRLTIQPPPAVRPGESLELIATLHVAAGYHVQLREPSDREAFRAILHVRGELDLACEQWKFPPPVALHGTDGHTGDIELRVTCRIPANTKPGQYAMRLTVLAQPCTDNACLPPERAGAGFMLEVT